MKYKLSFFLLLVLFFCHSLHSQVVPSIEWAKCFGGSGDDYGYSIQQTTDGGFVAAGFSFSNDGDITEHHGCFNVAGCADSWIVRLDPSGNLVWQKSLGGSNEDAAWSVQQTTDGGFIVAGFSDSNDGDVSGNHGYDDCWIVKLDTDGNIIWQKSIGGSSLDAAYSIQQTTDGGFVVAGRSYSNDGDVTGHHGGVDTSDSWIIRLDAVGNLVWQKSLGGTFDESAYSIQQTNDGGFIVAGYSNSNDGDVTGNHSNYYDGLTSLDYWIVKLDTLGNVVWEKSFGGSGGDEAFSIRQTTDGGYIIGGWTSSLDGDVSGNHNYLDYWIVKTDPIGNLVWQKCFGGLGDDQGYSVQQTTDSGFIVAGFSSSISGDATGNHGFYDYWIVKADAGGNLVWQKSLGGSSQDRAEAIQQTSDSGFIVTGWINSNDGDVSGSHGNYEMWVVKLTIDSTTGIPSLTSNSLSIFPNPVQTQLTLDLAKSANESTIRIYDLQGRLVTLPLSFSSTQAQLNTEQLPAGFYMIQITDNKTSESQQGKFVKE